jgi:hyperosmotically inducible protein
MHWNQQVSRLAAALCLATVIVSCRTTEPASEQVDDAWITTKIHSKYIADPDVKELDISVTTEEGVVYLTGRVSRLDQRTEAERLAAETEGVRSVVNHIQVGDKTD